MYELRVKSSFSAAHRLNNYQGNCERMHGHNWGVEVVVRSQELDDVGLAIDFRDVKAALKGVIDGLDHQNLSDLEPFRSSNPSSELIAKYIYNSIKNDLEKHKGVTVHAVTVWESADCSATYYALN